jgi:hypothetical protein
MAEKLDPKSTVSSNELLFSILYTQEALINLLDAKGVSTKKEILEEVERIKAQHPRGA